MQTGTTKNETGTTPSSRACLRRTGSVYRFFSYFSVVGLLLLAFSPAAVSQQAPEHSVARQWNEALLYAIRRDFARPTVHARNLFHSSAAMYDAWAVYDDVAKPFFLGREQRNGEVCEFDDSLRDDYRESVAEDDAARERARETAISVAMHRLLSWRFASSPGFADSQNQFDSLLAELQVTYDEQDSDTSSLSAEALGNSLADCIIAFGLGDGSKEQTGYDNDFYQPVNASLDPNFTGNPTLADPDRWQPLMLNTFIDQSGNPGDAPVFLSPEWGDVVPFALVNADISERQRDGNTFRVYLDPGAPALHGDVGDDYHWGHSVVALWSSHLDPADGVIWDISPASVGGTAALPESIADLRDFYNATDGGAQQTGHLLNPVTGSPYAENLVPRGDYTRVLAEFWADGPDSETPPGHWFSIFNEAVLDHPAFERRFEGTGDVLAPLEFEVRSYFLLGSAMHDAAIAAWSVKGWYDYIRPVSALRFMADNGQSSDPAAPNYHVDGIPLVEGSIELVEAGDFLAGNGGSNVGKIKVRAWRGPGFIRNPATDTAGVDWILLENWWPYQRPTFVTPPFAGYVSGHSTFSRAAAEILTRLTGDEFFPGGLAEFVAPQDDFLVFEQGPSVEVVLQWATYRDASDQTSLSRIWGGIHPPVDDVPGRRMGIEVADKVFERAISFFEGSAGDSELTHASGSSGRPGDPDGPGTSGGGGVVGQVGLTLLMILSSIRNVPARRRTRRRFFDDSTKL